MQKVEYGIAVPTCDINRLPIAPLAILQRLHGRAKLVPRTSEWMFACWIRLE